ncbi:ferredoxin [Pseudonocardia sp. Cha107L01]|uniref:ferredoxin n=1 Tax=Pseudonocardia sp. Cha107L01 TaxID=3457576 RepID=UPI00403E6C0F
MKICVDTNKCLGNGLCEAAAEDIFEVGKDAVVRVLVDAASEDRRADIEQAVEDCPVGALSIQD